VDAVAIEAVMEATAECSDRGRAEAALVAALAAARAPRRGSPGGGGGPDRRWHLEMRVSTAAPGMKVADAHISDDDGHPVADRSISDRTAGTCVALARAVSAWAQVVLDDELVRAHDETEREKLDAPAAVVPTAVLPSPHADGERADVGPKAEADTARPPTYEVGTMLLLRNGVASTGGIFGASPFVTVAFSEIWVLRPSLAIGTSTSRITPDDSSPGTNFTYLGGRIDFCRRIPGNYIDRRGIEFDVCAGGDAGYVTSRINDVVRASLGPSAVLRGEIGANFGLETRVMAGANLLRAGLGADAPFFVASGEVGGSVRFR
jgi:hypothetical protein